MTEIQTRSDLPEGEIIRLLREKDAKVFNAVDNSGIFRVYATNVGDEWRRQHLVNLPVFAGERLLLRYSGDELYQTERDILHCLIQTAEDKEEQSSISLYMVICSLGLTTGGTSYKMAEQALSRMADASVSILFDGESERIARIISEISIEKRVVKYALDKDFLSLFGMYESKYIDWEKRGRLPKKNNMAKKLQCLFGSRIEARQTHSIKRIFLTSGLHSKPTQFIKLLKRALDELMKCQIISSYEITKAQRGNFDKRMLTVVRSNISNDCTIPPV